MNYLKWILKLLLSVIVAVIVIDWVTNPYNLNLFFDSLSTGNIILISKAMLPIGILIFLVTLPIILRPLPFNISPKISKTFRLIYLIVSYGVVNVLQKHFFRQNEIVLTKAENITIIAITIISLVILYRVFVSRGGEEVTLTQEEKKIQEGKEALKELRAFGKRHKGNKQLSAKERANEPLEKKDEKLEEIYNKELTQAYEEIEEIKTFVKENDLATIVVTLFTNDVSPFSLEKKLKDELIINNLIYKLEVEESSCTLPDGEYYCTMRYNLLIDNKIVFKFNRTKDLDSWGDFKYGVFDIESIIIDKWVGYILTEHENIIKKDEREKEKIKQKEMIEKNKIKALRESYSIVDNNQIKNI